MAELAALNLSACYERQLLENAHLHGGANGNNNNLVPAIVITGFLGSGKTTLVRHLLRQTAYVIEATGMAMRAQQRSHVPRNRP
jgi:ABC-type proline/glycine betaine transport system ATPase subunit